MHALALVLPALPAVLLLGPRVVRALARRRAPPPVPADLNAPPAAMAPVRPPPAGNDNPLAPVYAETERLLRAAGYLR